MCCSDVIWNIAGRLLPAFMWHVQCLSLDIVVIFVWSVTFQVEQCRSLAESLISSYPDCETPGLIQAALYVRQKNAAQAIECLQVSYGIIILILGVMFVVRSSRWSQCKSSLVHFNIPVWKSTTDLSAMPHLVSGMNFSKNFANLLMMSPCHCHLIFLSPVHHHHHHHHFHYALLHLCSTLDAKLPFS